jgi:hypothetical protein
VEERNIELVRRGVVIEMNFNTESSYSNLTNGPQLKSKSKRA